MYVHTYVCMYVCMCRYSIQLNDFVIYSNIIYGTDPPPVYNITTSSSITPADLTGFDIIISWSVSIYTVLLKDNVANARNFFAIYKCVSSVTSAF